MRTRCLPLSGTHLSGPRRFQGPTSCSGSLEFGIFRDLLEGNRRLHGPAAEMCDFGQNSSPAPGHADREGFTVIQRPAGQGCHAFSRIKPAKALIVLLMLGSCSPSRRSPRVEHAVESSPAWRRQYAPSACSTYADGVTTNSTYASCQNKTLP